MATYKIDLTDRGNFAVYKKDDNRNVYKRIKLFFDSEDANKYIEQTKDLPVIVHV